MLARAIAATPWGIEARPVEVEVDVQLGLPRMQLVGMPDIAVRESRDRVQSAVRNCGFQLPPRSVVISLAPADLKKVGNHLDLAISLALLAACGQIPHAALDRCLICGELGLDGSIRPVRGGLAIADLAQRLAMKEVLLPAANANEAAALRSIPVIPLRGLADAIEHLVGVRPITPLREPRSRPAPPAEAPDLSEVRGQSLAKRALEIAAAGGHNLLFIGPPGSGKTMLARRLPALLPPLTLRESIEVTKIHSLVAEEPPSDLIKVRPFASPHTGTSTAGMVGGGNPPRPGEVSLAHAGVLFLDELPEFRRETLEALRQPLEEGHVTVVRARSRMTFPARFALLAAGNPCPCGHLGDSRHPCRCPPALVERYRSRISGPLLDRIDLHVEVPAVKLTELRSPPGETSHQVAQRVLAARRTQMERFGKDASSPTNAAMSPEGVHRHCSLDAAAQGLLDTAFEKLGLSARSLTRILKVARTLADLAQRADITAPDLAEAIQYRSLDRRFETRSRRSASPGRRH